MLYIAPLLNAHADILCYRFGSKKIGNKNVVQLFKGTSCPNGFSRVPRSALIASSNTSTGATGATGPTGPVGPSGASGASGASLFDLSGATGETTLDNSTFNFVSILGVGGTIGTNIMTIADRAVPVTTTCSSIRYFVEFSSSVGDGVSWGASLLISDGYDVTNTIPLCTISGSDTSCTGETSVSVASGQGLLLLFIPDTSPTASKAHWNIRCTAN